MKNLNQLERKYGKYAIHRLILYIVFANAIVYIAAMLQPGFLEMLVFDSEKVMQGQVWRVITFVFIPPDQSLLWVVFALYFDYLVGNALEQAWGSFKFNIYFFLGMLCTIVAAFITGIPMSNYYLGLTLFFAFARLFPDFELLIFFVLPVKIKYLAYISWAILGIMILMNPWPMRFAILIMLINFFVFFGKDIVLRRGVRRKSAIRKNEFKAKVHKAEPHFHQCAQCGRTEVSNPELEFRYCSKCEGRHEYCMDHLFSHTHKR